MNTLRETDRGKARPSVWPVYLAAGMVGVVGLLVLFIGIWGGLADEDNGGAAFGVLFGLVGALGVVVAWGLFRLRTWAWWCVVLSIFILFWTFLGWLLLAFVFQHPEGGEALLSLSSSLVVAVLLLWALVPRQSLFFPPKPEGEE